MAKAKGFARFLPFITFLVLAGALYLALTYEEPAMMRIGSYEMVQRPLPEFSLPLAGEKDRRIGNLSLAGEPAIINFFASWCAPCRMEHPPLLSLSRRGYPVYGILWKDRPENIAEMLKDPGNPYRAIGLDAEGKAAVAFGILGTPETFVIDRAGTIVHRHIGPLTQHDADKALAPLLERLRHER